MTWLVRRWIQAARPCARARILHMLEPSFTMIRVYEEIVDVDPRLVAVVLVLGVRDRRADQLGQRLREFLG